MALSNAEKQAQWRQRREQRIKDLERKIDKQEIEIEQLRNQLRGVSAVKTQDPTVVEQIEALLAELAEEGKKNIVTMSPPAVAHAAAQLERVLCAAGIIQETPRMQKNRKRMLKEAIRTGVDPEFAPAYVAKQLGRKLRP